MIIVPEIKTVVILVPRTGSKSLHMAIKQRYPMSFMLYRHGEANLVPWGYDMWTKVGVARHPIGRLWSLYNFIKQYDGRAYTPEFFAKLRASVEQPFEDWLINNDMPFAQGYRDDGYDPFYMSSQRLPENRKSQYIYLRPDLGTKIFTFETGLELLSRRLDINLPHEHFTNSGNWTISIGAAARLRQWLQWDFQYYENRGLI